MKNIHNFEYNLNSFLLLYILFVFYSWPRFFFPILFSVTFLDIVIYRIMPSTLYAPHRMLYYRGFVVSFLFFPSRHAHTLTQTLKAIERYIYIYIWEGK